LLARAPTPEEAVEMGRRLSALLDLLDEPGLRQVALWKVEGYTNEEIAAKLDCVPRTVERKVRRIRLLWQHELKGSGAMSPAGPGGTNSDRFVTLRSSALTAGH